MLSGKHEELAMRLTTFYGYRPQQPGALPAFIPVSGEFDSVEAAREVAISTATENPRFTNWCVRFEIEDDDGNIVSKWQKDEHANRT